MLLATALTFTLSLPAPPPALPPQEAGERLSLEELLSHYREARELLLGSLRVEAEDCLRSLRSACQDGDSRKIGTARKRLERLGPECAPLLVAALEPGPAAKDPEQRSAREVARVLREWPIYAITDKLLESARKGSREGQRNALLVLAATEQPGRVSPVVIDLFENGKQEVRGAALGTLAAIGGDSSEAYIGGVLASPDSKLALLALGALIEARAVSMKGPVLSLVGRATENEVAGLTLYYRVCNEALDEEACEALLGLAVRVQRTPTLTVSLLDFLAENEKQWPKRLKKDIKNLAGSGSPDIARAALIALTRAGDRQAKRDLLAPYDAQIDGNESWPRGWTNRAYVNYRIGAYRDAIKDYKRALQLATASGRPDEAIFLGLARCYARQDDLKDAASWLERAPISLKRLRALRSDPDFQELAAHPKHGKVFPQ